MPNLLSLPLHALESIILDEVSNFLVWTAVCRSLRAIATSASVKARFLDFQAAKLDPEVPRNFEALLQPQSDEHPAAKDCDIHPEVEFVQRQSCDRRTYDQTTLQWALNTQPLDCFASNGFLLPRDRNLIKAPHAFDFLDLETLRILHHSHLPALRRLRHFILVRVAFWCLEKETCFILDHSGANVNYGCGWVLARFALNDPRGLGPHTTRMIERLVFRHRAEIVFDKHGFSMADELLRVVVEQLREEDLALRIVRLLLSESRLQNFVHREGLFNRARARGMSILTGFLAGFELENHQ